MKKKYHPLKNHMGAMTVEYAIVFPLVVICVILLIYFGLFYYQQALLQSVVGKYVQDQALLWSYDFSHMQPEVGISGRKDYQSKGLYWQFFSNVNGKKEALKEMVRGEIIERSILKPSDELDIQVEYENYILTQKIWLQVHVKYSLPIKDLFQSFGIPGEIHMGARSETTIRDQKEFIDDIDYLLQIYEETGAKDWVKEKCEPLVNSLQKIKDYLR